MTDRKPEIGNQKSEIVVRYAIIGIVMSCALALGHFGLRPAVMERGAAFGLRRAFADVPAPPQSRRIGGPGAAGPGGALALYVSDESAEAVASFFRREMPSRGWRERLLTGSASALAGTAFPQPQAEPCEGLYEPSQGWFPAQRMTEALPGTSLAFVDSMGN